MSAYSRGGVSTIKRIDPSFLSAVALDMLVITLGKTCMVAASSLGIAFIVLLILTLVKRSFSISGFGIHCVLYMHGTFTF